MQQKDCSDSLLWNLGGGKLIEYTWLLHSALKFQAGTPFNAQILARTRYLKSIQVTTSINQMDFDQAITGNL